jgi:hypothetical protein
MHRLMGHSLFFQKKKSAAGNNQVQLCKYDAAEIFYFKPRSSVTTIVYLSIYYILKAQYGGLK